MFFHYPIQNNIGKTRYDTDSCVSFLLNQCGCSIDHWWSADMDIVIYLSRSEMIIFFGSKLSDFCQRYGLFCMMEWSAILALMRGHLSLRPLFFKAPAGSILVSSDSHWKFIREPRKRLIELSVIYCSTYAAL